MHRTHRLIPGALLAVALVVLCACGAAPEEGAEAAALLAVEAGPVARSEGYEVTEIFVGRVVSRRRSELGFERGGKVVAVRVDDGARVTSGQELAALESRELEAQRRELRARVGEMEARLALARRTAERRGTLHAEDSISEQAFDEARFEAEALAASLAAARAALRRIEVALELSRIVAPYDGIVVDRQVDEGTVVAPGQQILRLIEADAPEVRVGLPPETAARLDRETAHAVEVEGTAREARLEAVLPSVEPDTRTVTAIFALEDDAGAVPDGAVARLRVTTFRDEPGYWLPIGALAESRRGLWSAYALRPAGAGGDAEGGPGAAPDGAQLVERREVQVIHAEAERAFVRGTLRDGETVILSGLHRVVPGQRVRVLEAPAELAVGER